MTENDRPAFTLALHKLALTVGYGLSDAIVQAYREGLADWPIGRILTALSACQRTCKTWPTVAEIRAAGRDDHAPGSQTPGRIGSADCASCGGTGWILLVGVHTSGEPARFARKCKCRG